MTPPHLSARSVSWHVQRSKRPVALGYHDVIDGLSDCSGFMGAGAEHCKLSAHQFLGQLDRFATDGRLKMISLDDIRSRSAQSCAILTFDDGGVSASSHIAGELERRGTRGFFFIATDFLNRPGFLTGDQVRDLHARGHIIGTHSCSHPTRMSACSWKQLLYEWSSSRSTLSEILGVEVRVASVPGGYFSSKVGRAASAAGINILFTSEPTTTSRWIDGCLVIGRFSVHRRTRTDVVASIARGSVLSQCRQAGMWKAKQIAKACSGALYPLVRERLLRVAYRSDARR